MLTPKQIIKGMLARQRQLLKLRSKPKRSRPSDKVIDRIVRPKRCRSHNQVAPVHDRYRDKQLGKLGAASKVRIIVKDGKRVSG